jgi:hypothetical protein
VARFRQVRKELVERIQDSHPRVAYLDDFEHPPGTFVIRLYTPDDNQSEILDTVTSRLVDLCVDEDLDIVIMPLREKPIPEAA